MLATLVVGSLYSECDTTVCHSSTPGGRYTHPSFADKSIKLRPISSIDLEHKIAQNPHLKVVNVLGKMLAADCRIKGSTNTPLRFLEKEAQNWDRAEEIVVYCACNECDASEKAYRLLTYLGFTNVWEYDEGIREWYQQGKAIEGPCKESYLTAKTCKD